MLRKPFEVVGYINSYAHDVMCAMSDRLTVISSPGLKSTSNYKGPFSKHVLLCGVRPFFDDYAWYNAPPKTSPF